MTKKITIIDYECGNLFSVVEACKYWGYEVLVSKNYKETQESDYLILPGVGAFPDAMVNLQKNGLDDSVKEHISKGKPLMGICLGHQLLLNYSEEFEKVEGLGIIDGSVRRFPVQYSGNQKFKVPQIQWNQVTRPDEKNWENTPLKHINAEGKGYFFFVHSYYTILDDLKYELAKTNYGEIDYTSSIIKENIFSCQFHPEKSGLKGLQIFKNWIDNNY